MDNFSSYLSPLQRTGSQTRKRKMRLRSAKYTVTFNTKVKCDLVSLSVVLSNSVNYVLKCLCLLVTKLKNNTAY